MGDVSCPFHPLRAQSIVYPVVHGFKGGVQALRNDLAHAVPIPGGDGRFQAVKVIFYRFGENIINGLFLKEITSATSTAAGTVGLLLALVQLIKAIYLFVQFLGAACCFVQRGGIGAGLFLCNCDGGLASQHRKERVQVGHGCADCADDAGQHRLNGRNQTTQPYRNICRKPRHGVLDIRHRLIKGGAEFCQCVDGIAHTAENLRNEHSLDAGNQQRFEACQLADKALHRDVGRLALRVEGCQILDGVFHAVGDGFPAHLEQIFCGRKCRLCRALQLIGKFAEKLFCCGGVAACFSGLFSKIAYRTACTVCIAGDGPGGYSRLPQCVQLVDEVLHCLGLSIESRRSLCSRSAVAPLNSL